MMGSTRLAVGLMSGTSMDGVDAALIETDGRRLVARHGASGVPTPPDLASALGEVIHDPARARSDPLDALVARLTDLNAEAVEALLRRLGVAPSAVAVVGYHGQTILHRPAERFTRQLGDGARLAARLGIDVVNDFRSADVAAGGQGAPLAPLYHAALVADLPRPVAILNIGGVANVTYIDGDMILAFDTGPGNAPIDDWMRRGAGEPFDRDGATAAAGVVVEDRVTAAMMNPFFRQPAPKSLDRNAFSAGLARGLSLADGAATLTAFTAASVAAARALLPKPPAAWYVGGGGRLNPVLMGALAERLSPAAVYPVDRLGWDGDALEAEAFAFLAVRSLDGLPLSLPGTTGAPGPLTGGVLHRHA